MDKLLDVRELAPKDRHAAIFSTFEGLRPGERFTFINDRDPKPLLYQFQSGHDGEFEWWPLEQGTDVWRVTIEKRLVADTDRTVTEYLEGDHRRLDNIFVGFHRAVKGGDWTTATAAFGEFNLGLRRHIKTEEEVLFPIFEDKTGMTDNGPTFIMKMEHTEIHALLDRMQKGTEEKDATKASEAAYAFNNVLSDHNMKEEHILYPESDGFMDVTERLNVVKKAQAY